MFVQVRVGRARRGEGLLINRLVFFERKGSVNGEAENDTLLRYFLRWWERTVRPHSE